MISTRHTLSDYSVKTTLVAGCNKEMLQWWTVGC